MPGCQTTAGCKCATGKPERHPFDIVADWHDKQAAMFRDMAMDTRSGLTGRFKAGEAAKHHAGSAAALRLHRINERRAALKTEAGPVEGEKG